MRSITKLPTSTIPPASPSLSSSYISPYPPPTFAGPIPLPTTTDDAAFYYDDGPSPRVLEWYDRELRAGAQQRQEDMLSARRPVLFEAFKASLLAAGVRVEDRPVGYEVQEFKKWRRERAAARAIEMEEGDGASSGGSRGGVQTPEEEKEGEEGEDGQERREGGEGWEVVGSAETEGPEEDREDGEGGERWVTVMAENEREVVLPRQREIVEREDQDEGRRELERIQRETRMAWEGTSMFWPPETRAGGFNQLDNTRFRPRGVDENTPGVPTRALNGVPSDADGAGGQRRTVLSSREELEELLEELERRDREWECLQHMEALAHSMVDWLYQGLA